jgi:hypothetical protein
LPDVPTYALVVCTEASGIDELVVTEFRDDATAVARATVFLSPELPVVGVARRSGDDLEFLGAWDWCGGAPRWAAAG